MPTARRRSFSTPPKSPSPLRTALPVTARVQIARVDYARNAATIVFCESDREAIEALSLGRHFHTTVSIGELRAPERAEHADADFGISHEMQVTLHALSGGKRDFDPYRQLEELVTGPLKERRQMLRAEDAIRAFQKAPSALARRTMLSRLAGFSDAQALSLLEGNRLPGSPQAAATMGEVRARRERMQAVAAITRRLKSNRLRFPVNAANPRYPGGRKAKALDVVTRRSRTSGMPFIGQIASIDREGNAVVVFMSAGRHGAPHGALRVPKFIRCENCAPFSFGQIANPQSLKTPCRTTSQNRTNAQACLIISSFKRGCAFDALKPSRHQLNIFQKPVKGERAASKGLKAEMLVERLGTVVLGVDQHGANAGDIGSL